MSWTTYVFVSESATFTKNYNFSLWEKQYYKHLDVRCVHCDKGYFCFLAILVYMTGKCMYTHIHTFYYSIIFWDRVSLCSSGWPWTHGNLSSLVFRVLGIQLCTTLLPCFETRSHCVALLPECGTKGVPCQFWPFSVFLRSTKWLVLSGQACLGNLWSGADKVPIRWIQPGFAVPV